MKKALILAVAVLAIPGVALAATPSHGAKAKVQYVLKGTLSAYTAYDKTTSTNGSVTILVKHANFHGKALKTMTLTFAVGAKTKVSLHGLPTIKDGDRGIVMVRAALHIPAADLAATLSAATPGHVIDQTAAQS